MAEVISRNTENSLLLLNEALLDHIEGDIHSGETGALTVTGLQHPEFSFFDGELNVLHIAEMLLKLLTNF